LSLLLAAESLDLVGVVLEDLHGDGHASHLVAPRGAGNGDLTIAPGEGLHGVRHRCDRLRDAVEQEPAGEFDQEQAQPGRRTGEPERPP
jgi:hypothetical protein